MRVTKLIKEYVANEVAKIYEKKTSDEEVAYEILRQEVADFRKKLDDELYHFAEKAIAAFREVHNIPNDVIGLRTNCSLLYERAWESELYDKSKKAEGERLEQRDNKINDILVSLELGGTKADLDRMIAEIKI